MVLSAIAFCLIALFLLRYAGLIYYCFVGGYALYAFWQQRYPLFYQLVKSLVLASAVVLAYLLYNYSQTGFFTGGQRYYPEMETWAYFFTNLLQGIFNEFSIVRNYFFSGYTDYYYLFFLVLQGILIVLLFRFRKHGAKRASALSNEQFPKPASASVQQTALLKAQPILSPRASFFNKNSPQCFLLCAGIFYLLLIILLRRLSPFATFDYRILAPFSLPLYLALAIYWMQDEAYFKKIVPYVTGFMLLSLLFNLPKEYLLRFMMDFFG